MRQQSRPEGVIDQVVALGRQLGLSVEEAVALRSTNNVVVWLRPSLVVAKIAMRPGTADRELTLATAMAATGAPIVPPAPRIGNRVHRVDGHDVTFWTYEPQDGVAAADAASLAGALFALHQALSDLRPMIPSPTFETQVTDAIALLDDPAFAPALRPDDRAVLREALEAGRTSLSQISDADRVIHGSPHRMNTVVVGGQPRFIDFETVQLGPVEWDMAHLEPAVATLYPGPYDAATLALCRHLISATTSTWCWGGIERGPDMRRHAEHHLRLVRSTRHREW
jgi:hypothetical protein